MNDLTDFLRQPFWGATPGDYIAFVAIALAAVLFKRPLAIIVARACSRLATRFSEGKYRTLFRSLVRKPLEGLISVILLFYACNFIEGPLSNIQLLHGSRKSGAHALTASDVVGHLFAFTGIIFTTLLLSRILDFIYRAQTERAHHHMQRERAQLLPLLKDVLKIVLWTMGFFWLLGVVFHVNIPALITGLGIGGVALALAAKESIENLLASFTILADKPFVVDDTVKLGALEGKVERIGFRSTRLRSSEGSLLIVPNKKLIDESLENLSGRDLRKMRLLVPLKYKLPKDELQSLMDAVRQAVEREVQVHGVVQVSVETFGELTMQILVVYFLPDDLPDDQIQETKNHVNIEVYGAVTERIMPGKEG
jgi:MscS family membrane protein